MLSPNVPRYLPFLTAVTGIYLVFELGFNARLLDVAGGLPSDEAINSMDRVGRIISGIAVTIAVWGLVIFPIGEERFWSFGQQAILCGIAAAVCITTVFIGEKNYIDHQAEAKTGAERRTAEQLALITRGLHIQDVSIEGIDLSPKALATPEGKSFSALFPVLTQSIPALPNKLRGILPVLVEDQILQQDTMESPEAFRTLAYDASVASIKNEYNQYVDAVNERINRANRKIDRANAAIDRMKSPDQIRAEIPARQDEAWSRYLRSLQRYRYTPETVPPRFFTAVRRKVIRQGVPVKADWVPTDKDGFYAAVRARMEDQLARVEARSSAPQGLPPRAVAAPLTFDQFVASKRVQTQWRQRLGVDANTRLRLGMSDSDVTNLLYRPLLARLVSDRVAELEAPDEAFEPGGQYFQQGIDAEEGVLVPPVALAASLAGALYHVTKFLHCLSSFFSDSSKRNYWLIAGTVILIGLAAFITSNPVSRSHIFRYSVNQVARASGPLPAMGTVWVVKAQRYAYPLNEWVRVHALGRLTYGANPSDPEPGS